LHLSDLHINKKTSIEEILELINFCNNLESDSCIITGDIIATKVKFIKKQLEILNLIKKEVFYISGNDDLFDGLEDLKKEV
ncbi:metallophosphoesterase, partial [Aliarcobacter butzleri]